MSAAEREQRLAHQIAWYEAAQEAALDAYPVPHPMVRRQAFVAGAAWAHNADAATIERLLAALDRIVQMDRERGYTRSHAASVARAALAGVETRSPAEMAAHAEASGGD